MKKQWKYCAPEEKAAILRRHLLEKEPISKLCGEVDRVKKGRIIVFIRNRRVPKEGLVRHASEM